MSITMTNFGNLEGPIPAPFIAIKALVKLIYWPSHDYEWKQMISSPGAHFAISRLRILAVDSLKNLRTPRDFRLPTIAKINESGQKMRRILREIHEKWVKLGIHRYKPAAKSYLNRIDCPLKLMLVFNNITLNSSRRVVNLLSLVNLQGRNENGVSRHSDSQKACERGKGGNFMMNLVENPDSVIVQPVLLHCFDHMPFLLCFS